MTEVFVLQTWIGPRTITDQGYWYHDLSDLFSSLHEAQTTRDEFYNEDRTRIVRAEIVLDNVVAETDDRNQGPDEPALKQRELFTV